MLYRILDYFFLIRPSVLIPCWTTLLLGYQHARGGVLSFAFPVRAFVLYSAIMGGSYILNQLFDIESDRRNKKLFLLSGDFIPVWAAVVEMALLWAIGVYLALKHPTGFKVFVGASLLMGILYSLPPVKLKGRPLLDLASNGLGYGLVSFLAGIAICAAVDVKACLYAIPYVLAVGGVFVNTTVVDLEGDRAAGETTTAVLLGQQASYVLSLLLVVAALVIAIFVRNYPCLITAAVSLPLFILALIRQDRGSTTLSFRVPPFILALVAGFFFPIYLVVLVLLLVLMRWYYKKRFGYDYPKVAEQQ